MSRSPIDAAKAAQGFVPAQERPRCGTCAHSVECYGSAYQCRKGGFLVSLYAVCNEWQQRPAASFKTR
jgi:hypothetical protein